MTSAAVRPDRLDAPGRTAPWRGFVRLSPPELLEAVRMATPRNGLLLRGLFGTLLLGLGLVLHFGLGATRVSGGQANPDGRSEFDLRDTPSSPNLNNTSAETPATPAPAPHLEPVSHRTEDDGNSPATAEPPGPALAEVAPPVPAPTVIEVPEYLRSSHRGETPMTRTWTRLGFPSLLAAALAASSARGQLDGEPDKADAILNQLKGVTSTLKELDNLKSLPKSLLDLEKKITDALAALEVNTELRLGTVQRDLNSLKEQYTQLKQDIDALRNRLATRPQTTALYPPAGQGTGRLRLVNTFPTPVSVLVNDRVYQLNPMETRYTEPLPAGMFTYEVLGIQERRSRALSSGETFLVHVYPR